MSGYMLLNRMFTHQNLKNLIYYNNSNIYEKIIDDFLEAVNGYTNNEIIDNIYNILNRKYRNEYYYENTLVNKLLFGIYSPNTTTALSQIPISGSIADFILINDRATVFEIKTELDSFYRLRTQIEDYYKVFKYVVVVTSEKKFSKLSEILSDLPVGINVITKKGTISRKLKKDPYENTERLEHRAIFVFLHKNEFENVIRKYNYQLPRVAPAFYYAECYKLFKNIPMEFIQQSILQELIKRRSVSSKQFKEIPYSLKAVSYSINLTKFEQKRLKKFLESEFKGE